MLMRPSAPHNPARLESRWQTATDWTRPKTPARPFGFPDEWPIIHDPSCRAPRPARLQSVFFRNPGQCLDIGIKNCIQNRRHIQQLINKVRGTIQFLSIRPGNAFD